MNLTNISLFGNTAPTLLVFQDITQSHRARQGRICILYRGSKKDPSKHLPLKGLWSSVANLREGDFKPRDDVCARSSIG